MWPSCPGLLSGRGQAARGPLPSGWAGPAGSGPRVSPGWSPALSAECSGVLFPARYLGRATGYRALERWEGPQPRCTPTRRQRGFSEDSSAGCTPPCGSGGGGGPLVLGGGVGTWKSQLHSISSPAFPGSSAPRRPDARVRAAGGGGTGASSSPLLIPGLWVVSGGVLLCTGGEGAEEG